MMRENLISVYLYGSGTRNSRLRAEYIYCDKADVCSAYKQGTCFCVTTLCGVRCGVGTVHCIDGGTKRSKAYGKVSEEARQNSRYAALSYPQHVYVTKIDDTAFLTLPYTWMEVTPKGNLVVNDPHLMTNRLTIGAKLLTPKNIMAICSATPRAIIGGVITDYQKAIVPHFLRQFKSLFPKEFEAFVKEYPEYNVPVCSWIGRRAKLATCNRNAKFKDTNNNIFWFDGDWLVCENYSSAFTPFRADVAEIRLKLTDKMEVKITDDDQVTDDTVFL